jgi:hypothetical protein
MVLADKIDDVGKAGWIVATVAGFWLFWPIGLAILLFLAWSGRMRAWRMERRGRWYNAPPGAQQAQGGPSGGFGPWGGGGGGCGWGWGSRSSYAAPPSGNAAFDEYRAETLRRLEEEQREFVEYLERLRRAKDKAEFDQFMAERRRPPIVPERPEQV